MKEIVILILLIVKLITNLGQSQKKLIYHSFKLLL